MKFLEEYNRIEMPIPFTKEEALIKMDAEKNLYEEFYRNGDIPQMNCIKIFYEYDRKKAIEMGADVSRFPKKLNYLENQN